MFKTKMDVRSQQNLAFRLLVCYRWLSLLPPLIWFFLSVQPADTLGHWSVLSLAAGLSLLLTVGATAINRWLLRYPWLLGFDLLVSAGLVWYTGVEQSPFYLYSLAPILAAALFFRIRGGMLAATVYTLFYLVALIAPASMASPLDIPSIIGQIISFFLIAVIFGYPSFLLQRLHTAHQELATKNEELSKRNRDLDLLQEISLVIQSSVDPAELQESILRGLVHEMGYARATIGLYADHLDALTSWITLASASKNGSSAEINHTDVVPLEKDNGPLARALKGKLVVEVSDGEAPTASSAVNERLSLASHYLVLPMSLRGQLIGIILVDRLPAEQRLAPADRLSLEYLATHAGVALGSLRMCIDRAQRQAISEERQRIAIDLHDRVSQALYGTAYGLEASIQMLPPKSDVRGVLTNLHSTIVEAQAQMRQAIFDMRCSEEITADSFVAGLQQQLRNLSPTRQFELDIDLTDEFDRWEAAIRSQLFQVVQEALANTVKHAQAQQFSVKLSRKQQQLELLVTDDGQGFELSHVDNSHHLGLQSMKDRLQSFGGTFEIKSVPGQGTRIVARLPYVASQALAEVKQPAAVIEQ